MVPSQTLKGSKAISWMMSLLNEQQPDRHHTGDGTFQSGKHWMSERHDFSKHLGLTCMHIVSNCSTGCETIVWYDIASVSLSKGTESAELLNQLHVFLLSIRTMFRVDKETGEIQMGAFFLPNFEVTQRIRDILPLQELYEPRTFAVALWETIRRCGGANALKDIGMHHLDQFEYGYRLSHPMEDLTLRIY